MVSTTYTTRLQKTKLLNDQIRAVYNAIDENKFYVSRAFTENVRNALNTYTISMRLDYARRAIIAWNSTSNSDGIVGARTVLVDRLNVLDGIIDHWDDDTPWTIEKGKLSFPFRHTGRNPTPQHTTHNNPANIHHRHNVHRNPPQSQSELQRMLLKLKQFS